MIGGAASRLTRLVRPRAALDAIDRFTVRGAQDRPIFLGGCPRSGTTLLRTMLHAHPDLAIPRETHFVLESFQRREEWGDLRDYANRRRLAEWIVTDTKATRFGRLGLDPDEACERMAAAPPTLGSVLGTAFMMYSERHNAARWGDKRPMYVQELPTLMALFPDVVFVNIVRDPRAVIASMRKLGWLEEWYDGTIVPATLRWLTSARAGRRAARVYRSDQYLELRYEDLLTSPERNLEAICNFTGLSTAHLDAMLRFHETDNEIPEQQHQKFHPRLNQPLTHDAMHSWSSQLSDEEVAFIERALRGPMAAYGYEPVMSATKVPARLMRRWRLLLPERPRLHRRPGAKSTDQLAARLTTGQQRRARYARVMGVP